MTEWIRAFRLPVCLLAAGLALVSFRIGGMRPIWSAVVATLLIACATMLQNDWRDRSHDGHKRKTLAVRHPKAFFSLVVAMWSVAFVAASAATVKSWPMGFVLFGAILAGLLYSEIRMTPMVPILLVAIVSAGPPLLAILAGGESKKSWLIFLAAALMIFGREIIKDLDDLHSDGGYKWTIPLAVGARKAKIIAVAAVTAGSIVALSIAAITLPGMILALAGTFFLQHYDERRIAKYSIDLGMAFAIIALGIQGY